MDRYGTQPQRAHIKHFQLSDTPIAHKKLQHFVAHERYVHIPIPVDVIRRWFDDELEKAGKDQSLGLYVSAMFGEKNLAEHPQDGDENVSRVVRLAIIMSAHFSRCTWN
jgi:hypothetical protein